MVIIAHYPPQVLNAYSTVPLTQSIIDTTQHGFYDGTSARFGNPEVVVTIHNRTDFHGLSHYGLRVALDTEGALSPFVVLDDTTPELDAVWYVETTAKSQYLDSVVDDVVTYPYENFTIWQIHIRVPDLPITQMAWSVGAGSLSESVPSPYDPHDPQPNIFHYYHYPQGPELLNWTDPNQFVWGGYLRVTANWSEVMWSNDPNITKWFGPAHPPVMVSLTDEAARANGFLRYFNSADKIAPPGKVVDLGAKCDWDSPRWPKGYPDNPGVVSRAMPGEKARYVDSGERQNIRRTESKERHVQAQIEKNGLRLIPLRRANSKTPAIEAAAEVVDAENGR
ncbi:MAG: hypothetical protein Q9226_004014 [Calogaya cf. arnoldii]